MCLLTRVKSKQSDVEGEFSFSHTADIFVLASVSKQPAGYRPSGLFIYF